jgi:hypothetical protein
MVEVRSKEVGELADVAGTREVERGVAAVVTLDKSRSKIYVTMNAGTSEPCMLTCT